ncbi:MAG: replication-associated recombination protein A [Armatimonadetes bacterium]|nr:replication-associated recombination protein A [Armatimonadota bacterium]MDE2206832.1 replication-associated recombination protein A [Armatimonadota bacterium]
MRRGDAGDVDGEPALFVEEPESDFDASASAGAPLAARMRPRTLDELVGQESIAGAGSQLRRAIEQDRVSSIILWGPPGSGKSTLARIVARHTRAWFQEYSAVTTGVADVRRVIAAAAERRRKLDRRTILFIDEIHRWNKAQQDALLPHVESGAISLIGATTENPYFEINGPLLSRVRLFRLQPLTEPDLLALLKRAMADKDRGLGALSLTANEDALEHLARIAGGDARRALTALEAASAACMTLPEAEGRLTLKLVEEAAQQRAARYDRTGDEHYDTISAFIKSIRGSDPDAAIYWLAKMLDAGEDIRFIARRLVILASEDVGNAAPSALTLANSAAQAVMFVGLPEAQLILAHATIYLACAPKSNRCTLALSAARAEIESNGAGPVPTALRSSGSDGLYLYPHDFPGAWVAQEYLPAIAVGKRFYHPGSEGAELEIGRRLEQRRGKAHNPES